MIHRPLFPGTIPFVITIDPITSPPETIIRIPPFPATRIGTQTSIATIIIETPFEIMTEATVLLHTTEVITTTLHTIIDTATRSQAVLSPNPRTDPLLDIRIKLVNHSNTHATSTTFQMEETSRIGTPKVDHMPPRLLQIPVLHVLLHHLQTIIRKLQ